MQICNAPFSPLASLPSPGWPHHARTADTLPSLRWLCADFCCYRHCVVLVDYMVSSWHDMSSFSFKESKDINTSHFALFSSYDVGNWIGGNPEFAKMGHPKGLTDKVVTDILISTDSHKDFGSDIKDELI